jgi:hypothetical protein
MLNCKAWSRRRVRVVEPHSFRNSETLSRACFTPVLAKHSKSFSLIDCISVGVDRMQRNFEPMRKQVEAWQIALGKAWKRRN